MHKKKGYGSSQWEARCLHQTENPHQTPTLPTPWSWAVQPPELWENINTPLLLKHPVYGMLLWQYNNSHSYTGKQAVSLSRIHQWFLNAAWDKHKETAMSLQGSCDRTLWAILLSPPCVLSASYLTALALTRTPHLTFFCGHPFIYLFFTLLFIHPSSRLGWVLRFNT